MTVLLNGQVRAIPGARTIAELIRQLNLTPEALLIEHNGLALQRAEWDTRGIAQGDRIELVQVAAGG